MGQSGPKVKLKEKGTLKEKLPSDIQIIYFKVNIQRNIICEGKASHCCSALSQLSSLFSLGYWLRKKAICSRRLIQCLDLNANYQIMVTLLKLRHHKEEFTTVTHRKSLLY